MISETICSRSTGVSPTAVKRLNSIIEREDPDKNLIRIFWTELDSVHRERQACLKKEYLCAVIGDRTEVIAGDTGELIDPAGIGVSREDLRICSEIVKIVSDHT